MSPTRIVRALLAWLGLVLFAAWLPIAAVTWLPGWHAASCDWHARCDEYGRPAAMTRIAELRAYMQHRGELPVIAWTAKERAHLAEVRDLLGRYTVLALLGALVFAHADAATRARAARWAMLVAAAGVIVLPFFGSFWRDVFHPLLFDNLLWKNNAADTSFWIMPRIYFHYTTALVVGVATLACALARAQAMRELVDSGRA